MISEKSQSAPIHSFNLGCRVAVSSAIDWFFENVDEGIILEDDCLPNQSFFRFCQEMLQKYRDDERIMQISGSNLLGQKTFNASYYFSKLNDIWGWATWRSAWSRFDINMKSFPLFKEQRQIENYFEDKEVLKWLMSYFQESFDGLGSVWTSQWSYAICSQNGLTIVPTVNLVSNIGFGMSNSTHGGGDNWNLYADTETYEMSEIIHPSFVLPDKEADLLRFETIRKTDPRLFLTRRIRSGIKAVMKKFIPRRYHRAM